MNTNTQHVVTGYLQWLSDSLDELTEDEYTRALRFAVTLVERRDRATARLLKREIRRHVHAERDGAPTPKENET
jgi:hypothetical protein